MPQQNKNFKYQIFNHTFSIDFPLKHFDTSVKSPDFYIEKGDLRKSLNYSKPWSLLSLNSAIIEDNEFLAKISAGKSIKYTFLKDFSKERKIIKLFHQPIAYILFQLGYFVLHGSAFANNNNEGVVLCGLSGSGKSQMLYEFSKNYKVISDDIVATNIEQGRILSPPGLPFICAQDKQSPAIELDSRERSYINISNHSRKTTSCIIKKVIFLEWGNSYNLAKLEDEDIFKKLILNSFRPLPQGNDRIAEKQFLANISNLVGHAEFYKFTRLKGNIGNSINFLKGFIDD